MPAFPEAAREAEAFSAIKHLLIERTGHFYYEDKDDLLSERLKRRMAAIGASDLSIYREKLRDDNDDEWSALEAEITVGETFFFRYSEQFDALRRTILPSIIERNRDSRRIRIWSAGCSMGAEGYSVAILLREALGDAFADWHVTIIGTDISLRSVAGARIANFSNWLLRGMSGEDRDRYFTPASNGTWTLRPAYRSLVRFQKHNLLDLLDAPVPFEFADFDLIFCRNVLIYFHPDLAARVIAALERCLVDDGWMFFGHAEAALTANAGLEAVPFAGTTAFRKGKGNPGTIIRPSFESVSPIPARPADHPWQPLLPADHPLSAGSLPSQDALSIQASSEANVVARVKELSDAGDVAAALDLCRKHLSRERLSPRLHFYEGVLQYASGRTAEAVDAFRRALFIRKGWPIAHFYLGLALMDSSDPGAGRRAIVNAVQLAEKLPPDSFLEDGDGMTAAALGKLARQYLDKAPTGSPL